MTLQPFNIRGWKWLSAYKYKFYKTYNMATQRKYFSDKEIDAVWEKAAKQPNNNPDVFRKDYAGAWIRREDYGKRNMPYGWEIDHLKPLAKDGTHDMDNLYPVHWRNNESKGDDYPRWKTVLSSEENKNVELEKKWKVDE